MYYHKITCRDLTTIDIGFHHVGWKCATIQISSKQIKLKVSIQKYLRVTLKNIIAPSYHTQSIHIIYILSFFKSC